MSRSRGARLLSRVGLVTALAIAVCLSVLPIVRLLMMSLMPPRLVFTIPPTWAFAPTLQSYALVVGGYQGLDLGGYFANSTIVASGATALTLLSATLGGYATARFRFPGRGLLAGAILATRMLPPVAMIVPLFLLVSRLGLLDTQVSLIAVYAALNIPFALWMLNGFYGTIPGEVLDAALVDGCGHLSALWRVALPLMGPGLAAAATFSFLLSWNDFALASVLTSSHARTLPLLINSFDTGNGVAWGPMAAASTIAVAPPIALLFLTRRWLVGGLTQGAVRG